MTTPEIIEAAKSLISRYSTATLDEADTLIPDEVKKGKLYEAHVLSKIVEKLATEEGVEIRLQGGSMVVLKSSPGPINRAYPHFVIFRGGSPVAELWTDIEFLTLSFEQSQAAAPNSGQYHELDIAIVDFGASGRPKHSEIWMGVECKNTGYGKNLLREILGVRRELSLLDPSQTTRFHRWPRSQVPAKPASCLLVYASDAAVTNYKTPGEMFGIDFFHEPI